MVVDPVKERHRNQEAIESFQEEIIEREEDVPAFKNMPKENYIKTEKTRRIQKEPITGQTTVHCPFCNHKRRTLEDLIKHMHQIHSREIRDKADEQSQTEKDDIKEIKVNFQDKKTPQIDIINTDWVLRLIDQTVLCCYLLIQMRGIMCFKHSNKLILLGSFLYPVVCQYKSVIL